MDKLFDVFVCWQTVAIALVIWMLTYVARTMLETIFPSIVTNRFWTKLFLPLGPIGTGLLFGFFAKKFPWPPALGVAPVVFSARATYSMICGLGSGWMFARYREMFKPKGTADDGSLIPAPAPVPVPVPVPVPAPPAPAPPVVVVVQQPAAEPVAVADVKKS